MLQQVNNTSAQNFPLDRDYVPRYVWDAPTPLRLWHLASLDAPTVAVVWAQGFGVAARVRLPVCSLVLLALVAWAVYIGDRLLDARAGTSAPPRHVLRDRHHFHWKHRGIFTGLALTSTAVATWIVFTLLPARAIKPDTVAAAATLAYFSTVHIRVNLPTTLARLLKPIRSREFAIGTLFTTACVLPVWSQPGSPFGPHLLRSVLLAPMIVFAAVAWLNCRAISMWESDTNAVLPDRVVPWARRIGFAGLTIAAVLLASHFPRTAALLAAGGVSALLLGMLDRMRRHITPVALRAAADLVLLTPLLVLPLAR